MINASPTLLASGRTPHILVADDEPAIREIVADVLTSDGYAVTHYDPVSSSPEILQRRYDVVITDVIMPMLDGFALRAEVAGRFPLTQFIMMTGHPDNDNVMRATDDGVYTFLIKPVGVEHIRCAVLGALRRREKLGATSECDAHAVHEIAGLTGNSPHLQHVRKQIKDLGAMRVPVLITGESGTGKEIVAHGIHRAGPRAAKTFVAVNCAALSPSLIESELFGHVQGAFTGAAKTKHGFFEVAHGGTLFLDEVGELPLDLQSKLLRVLDNGEFVRVGETSPRKTDVRIVSATNRDLEAMIKGGRFRGDLYYRLKGGSIILDPLRNRTEDIVPLVHLFLGDGYTITPQALKLMTMHQWPGNTRELRMACATAKVRCIGKLITPGLVEHVLGMKHTPQAEIQPYRECKDRIVQNFEREYFTELLQATAGNLTRAAERSGMDRKNLREKMKQVGLYAGEK